MEESYFEGTDLIEKNIVTKQSLLLFQSMTGHQADLSDLKQVLMLKILDEQVVTGKITFEEGKLLWQFLNHHYARLNGDQASIMLICHLGLPFVIGALNREMVIFDEGDKLILEIEVMKKLGQIKLALLG